MLNASSLLVERVYGGIPRDGLDLQSLNPVLSTTDIHYFLTRGAKLLIIQVTIGLDNGEMPSNRIIVREWRFGSILRIRSGK